MNDSQFATLCAAQYPRLVGALRLHLRDDHVAEELAQEALARAYRDWTTVRAMTAPAAWILRVAFNLANSHHRRRSAQRRAHRRIAAAGETPDTTSSTDDVLLVRATLARLRPRTREALILCYYADLSVAEVARLMRCPESTVKTLTRRGLMQLRAQPEFAAAREGHNG